MREIKFRAFDKDTSTMYMQNDLIINFDEIGEDVYIHKDNHVTPMFAYELTQYTGLKDINGTEIYEGDIISYKHITYTDCSKTKIEKIEDESFIEIITYAPIASIVKPHSKNVKCFGYDSFNKECLILDLTSDEVEVIGNIYENAELLEGIDNDQIKG